jgi:integrase
MASDTTIRNATKASARQSRIYWRNQGGKLRAYADLRDLGGGQVALIPKGEKRAATDPVIAEELLRQRLNDLAEKRRSRVLLGIDPDAELASYAIRHLQLKAESGEYSDRWLVISKKHLDRAVAFFTRYQHASEAESDPEPRARNLAAISATDVQAYAKWLRDQANGRGGTQGKQTIRHHLHALSNLFKRAISEGIVGMGQNPVVAMMDKPTVPLSTTKPLEAEELALLLESARTLPRGGAGGRERLLCAYELIATLALTGLRENEARHLDIRDVDFGAACIDVRGSKTRGSIRTVPLHPQLADILHPYVQRLRRKSGPLFTGRTGGPFGTWTGTLDAIAARVGYAPGEVRTRRFRVSYATHRSTCDGVDSNTVRLELGHGSFAMMERVYARAQRRSRRMGAEMAFRIEALGPEHAETVAKLRSGWEPSAGHHARRRELVQRFLEAVKGKSAPQVEALTGIPAPTVNRFRAGQGGAQTANLGKMREYLARLDGYREIGSATRPRDVFQSDRVVTDSVTVGKPFTLLNAKAPP